MPKVRRIGHESVKHKTSVCFWFMVVDDFTWVEVLWLRIGKVEVALFVMRTHGGASQVSELHFGIETLCYAMLNCEAEKLVAEQELVRESSSACCDL